MYMMSYFNYLLNFLLLYKIIVQSENDINIEYFVFVSLIKICRYKYIRE